MTEKTEARYTGDPVQKEADRLRKKFSSTEETTFTIERATLGDGDIESVAVTFTVPSSVLLEKMVVGTGSGRSFGRKDPMFADNDDGADAFQDGGLPDGDLPQ